MGIKYLETAGFLFTFKLNGEKKVWFWQSDYQNKLAEGGWKCNKGVGNVSGVTQNRWKNPKIKVDSN